MKIGTYTDLKVNFSFRVVETVENKQFPFIEPKECILSYRAEQIEPCKSKECLAVGATCGTTHVQSELGQGAGRYRRLGRELRGWSAASLGHCRCWVRPKTQRHIPTSSVSQLTAQSSHMPQPSIRDWKPINAFASARQSSTKHGLNICNPQTSTTRDRRSQPVPWPKREPYMHLLSPQWHVSRMQMPTLSAHTAPRLGATSWLKN